MIIATARLRIRKLNINDAPFVLGLVNEPSFILNIADKGIETLADAELFIREGPWTNQQKPGYGQFAVELKETDDPIGICGLLFREALDVTDIGFAFFPRYWGKGYALEAAEAMLEYGKRVLGVKEIVGLTSADNLGSIRLLEKLGMEYERTTKMSDDDPGTVVYSQSRKKQCAGPLRST